MVEQVIPAIEREQQEPLTVNELTDIATALEEVVEDYTTQMEGLALMATNLRKYTTKEA